MQINTLSFRSAYFSKDKATQKSLLALKEKHTEEYKNLAQSMKTLDDFSNLANQDVSVKLNTDKDKLVFSADIEYKSGTRKAKITDKDIAIIAENSSKSIEEGRKNFILNCLSAIQTNHYFSNMPDEDSAINGYQFTIKL